MPHNLQQQQNDSVCVCYKTCTYSDHGIQEFTNNWKDNNNKKEFQYQYKTDKHVL